MSTRIISLTARLLGGTLILLSTVSCGSELLRTGRSPVYLVVVKAEGVAGKEGAAGTPAAFLQSDVQAIVDQTVGGVTTQVRTVFNDSANVTLRVDPKNPDVPTTLINAVTLTKYRVEYVRSDGRNTPGVDVPYAIEGGLTATIDANGTATVAFDLVRHQAKLEPPLKNLAESGGQVFISAVARITIYGRDQNGNELVAPASISIQFADFADQ